MAPAFSLDCTTKEAWWVLPRPLGDIWQSADCLAQPFCLSAQSTAGPLSLLASTMETQPHVDRGNSELYPSLLLGLTHHCGGELRVQSAEGGMYLDTPQGMLRGVALSTSASAVLFTARLNCMEHFHGSLANGACSSRTLWRSTKASRTLIWRCFWMRDLCHRSPEAAEIAPAVLTLTSEVNLERSLGCAVQATA